MKKYLNYLFRAPPSRGRNGKGKKRRNLLCAHFCGGGVGFVVVLWVGVGGLHKG